MKHMVCKNEIGIVGRIWMPAVVCAMDQNPSAFDVENMRPDDGGPITRDDVEDWLTAHSGDFQEVIDFRASLEVDGETVEFPFSTEDGEIAYCDCMFGSVED